MLFNKELYFYRKKIRVKCVLNVFYFPLPRDSKPNTNVYLGSSKITEILILGTASEE